MSIRIEECVFIEFPIDLHGRYIINVQELKFWNKTSLKKLVNTIINDWCLSDEEQRLLMQEIERQLLDDYEMYNGLYDRFGLKIHQKIAVKCIDVARICKMKVGECYE